MIAIDSVNRYMEGTLDACGRVVHRQEFVSVRTGQVDIIDVERMKEVHFRDTHDEEFNSRKLGSIKRLKAANPLRVGYLRNTRCSFY